MKTFTINCNSSTRWLVRVNVYQNRKKLLKARKACAKKIKQPHSPECQAFCEQIGADDTRYAAGTISEIHLYSGRGSCLENIVHEVTHAAVHFRNLCRIDLVSHDGDEWFAETVEYLVCGIYRELKKTNKQI